MWIVNDATVKGSESGSSFRQALYFMSLGLKLHDTMIWHKPHFANPSSNRCHQVFEYMFIFSKGKPKTFHQIKDVPIKYGKPVGVSSWRRKNGDIQNRKNARESEVGSFGGRSNVWKMNTVGQESWGKRSDHPASFPESLARDHILSWSNEGDLVLDPFMGSGTTGKVAKQLKRSFIGIEISGEYFNLSKSRIKEK